MRISKTVSITLPPEMLLYATKTAKAEHRTMSELVREALRCYESMRQWGVMRGYAQSQASVQRVEEGDIIPAIKQVRDKLWPQYKKSSLAKTNKGRAKRKTRNE